MKRTVLKAFSLNFLISHSFSLHTAALQNHTPTCKAYAAASASAINAAQSRLLTYSLASSYCCSTDPQPYQRSLRCCKCLSHQRSPVLNFNFLKYLLHTAALQTHTPTSEAYAAASASATNAAHASTTAAAAAAAEEAGACAELSGKLSLPVVLATPPELIHDAPGTFNLFVFACHNVYNVYNVS